MPARVWLIIGILGLNICLLSGQDSLWEQHLAKARKEFPQDAAFCDLLGVVQAEEGDYGGAESNFLKAIELDPVLAGAYLNLGHLYQQNAAAHHDAPQKALAIYGLLARSAMRPKLILWT